MAFRSRMYLSISWWDSQIRPRHIFIYTTTTTTIYSVFPYIWYRYFEIRKEKGKNRLYKIFQHWSSILHWIINKAVIDLHTKESTLLKSNNFWGHGQLANHNENRVTLILWITFTDQWRNFIPCCPQMSKTCGYGHQYSKRYRPDGFIISIHWHRSTSKNHSEVSSHFYQHSWPNHFLLAVKEERTLECKLESLSRKHSAENCKTNCSYCWTLHLIANEPGISSGTFRHTL